MMYMPRFSPENPDMYIEPYHTISHLKQLLTKAEDPLRTRIRGIILAKLGGTRSSIAEECGVCEHTVYGWIRKYNNGSIDALHDKPSGRPPIVPPEARSKLITTFQKLAASGEQITASDVKNAIERDLGVEMKSEETARSLIRDCGFGWKFSKLKHQR